MTDRILALIDSSPYAESVCRHAAWIARRLGTGIDLVHVIPKDAPGGSDDYTGTLRLGARTALLQKLAAIDAERAKLAKDRGQALLEDARAVLDQDGIADVREKLRQGELVEAVAELEREARAVVIGKRGEGRSEQFAHLGANLERILRSVTVPVLVASRSFQPISSALIAFDGSESADHAVDRMAQSPVFRGLDLTLTHVGTDNAEIRGKLEAAQAKLAAAGLETRVEILAGDPAATLGQRVAEANTSLLVMGAYGHSRIRSLIIGSTTTAMIRACRIPVLVFR